IPLVPAFHQAVFLSVHHDRAILNIGGCGHVTVWMRLSRAFLCAMVRKGPVGVIAEVLRSARVMVWAEDSYRAGWYRAVPAGRRRQKVHPVACPAHPDDQFRYRRVPSTHRSAL